MIVHALKCRVGLRTPGSTSTDRIVSFRNANKTVSYVTQGAAVRRNRVLVRIVKRDYRKKRFLVMIPLSQSGSGSLPGEEWVPKKIIVRMKI